MKRVEDYVDIAEAARSPCVDAKITNKVFSALLKEDIFHDGVREWRRKSNDNKTWANFKLHFAVEMKECEKSNKLASKATVYQVVNSASQALIETKNYLKYCTSSIMQEFQK